ncbi:MAG: hypothetical protein JRI70_11735 [Deltaproteobacteria bacterium]|nr:hypothetical protein [Deltaproteobacteria bacterium]
MEGHDFYSNKNILINYFNIEPIKDGVEVVTANVGDRSIMDQHVRHQDIVFNIGMHSCHLDSMQNPVFDIETNVVPQINFLPANH